MLCARHYTGENILEENNEDLMRTERGISLSEYRQRLKFGRFRFTFKY